MKKLRHYSLDFIFCALLFIFLVIPGAFAQDWDPLEITPGIWSDADLRDIFLDDGQGWAVGENGAIAHTHNGVRWRDQISGVSVDLNAVHFVDPLEGWAVGEDGVILHTENSGATWTQQTTGSDLYDIHFIDERYGWAVGEKGLVLYTDNAGFTWKIGRAGSFGQADLMSVHFVNQMSGWAVGKAGVILHWNGIEWLEQTNPSTQHEYLQSVYFSNATDGWIVGDSGLILHTTDAGTNWVSWKNRAPNNNLNLYDIYFVSGQSEYGWIVGEDGFVLRTSNSGNDWWKENVSITNDLRGVYASSVGNIWAVGNSGVVMSNWEVFANPTYGNFWDISYDIRVVREGNQRVLDPRGWIVGDDGVIIKLQEDGETWIDHQTPTSKNLYGVYMLDKFNVWAVGDEGVIARTTDGLSWTLDEPITDKTLRGAFFTRTNNGWAVGDSGTVCYWDGIVWSKQVSNVAQNLNDVYFIDDTEGWAVGEFGTALYTNDGGSSWSSVDTESSLNLRGVFFADSNNGWIVGDSGTILQWQNGVFIPQTSGTSQAFFDVDFVDSDMGWASGGNGLTASTPNGGARWDLHLTAPATGNLYGIDFADQLNGVVVGQNAVAMKYTGVEPAPAIALNTPEGNIIGRTVEFKWNTDKPNLDHTVFIDDDDQPYDNPIYRRQVSGATSLILTNELNPGTYYWGVQAIDGTRSSPLYKEFTLWPPTEVKLASPSGFIAEDSPTFQWNCNNEGLSDQGLLTYTLYIDDDGTPFDGIEIDTDGNLNYTLSSADPLTNLSEGEYIWGVKTDGLEVVQSDTITIKVDLSAPTGTININDGDGFTNSLNVNLALTASDTLDDGENGSGVTEMQFSNNGSDWSAPEPFASTRNWNLLQFGGSSADGEKTVYARFKDALGHWTAPPITGTITVDTVPPFGTISINDGAEVTGLSDITLNLSASDDRSGMEPGGKMILSNDGIRWSDEVPYVTSREWDFSVLGGDNDEGTKTVYVIYIDAAGNQMEDQASDDIELDKTGPTGTIAINDGAPLTDSSLVDLTLAASDKSGVQYMKFTNGSGKWSPLEPYSTKRENWNLTAAEYGGSSISGTKTVYVRFVDSVGNESAEAEYDDITYKTEVSVSVEIFAPLVEGKIRDNDIVGVDGMSEPGVTLVSMEVLDDAGQPIDIDLSGVIYDTNTGLITGSFPVGELTVKNIQLQIAVEDSLGNKADATSNILTVDNEPPGDASISINQLSPINFMSITLTLSATEAVEMYLDGDIQDQRKWIPYAESLTTDITASDGNKELGVKFRDEMGNETARFTDQIFYDTTPPQGSILIDNGANFTAIFQVLLTLSATDATGLRNYQLSNDGNIWSDAEPMTADEMDIDEWSLKEYGGDDSEGTKTVYARFEDNAGNWSDPVSDEILVDSSAPEIGWVPVKGDQEAMEPVIVSTRVKSNRPLISVELHYRRKGTTEYTSIIMTQLSGGWYSAEIPGQEITLAGIEYYLSADDGRFVATHPPRNAPVEPHSFDVVDTMRPVIEHEPVREVAVKSSPEVFATVTDSVGVKSVKLFYRKSSDRNYTQVDMTRGAVPEEYSASIPALDSLGTVLYYLEALDSSGNSRTLPAKGVAQPYSISFVDKEPPVIAHTAIRDDQEAGNAVLIGATVTDNMVVDHVILKYKPSDKEESVEIEMPNIGSYYSMEIPGEAIMPGEVEYSITASDGSPQSEDVTVSHSFAVIDTSPPDIDLTFAPSEIHVQQQIEVEVEVNDKVSVTAVRLYYKGVTDLTFNVMDMSAAGNTYSATIGGQDQPGEVRFYVYAEDSYNNSSTEPEVDPQNAPRIVTVIDTTSPSIEHSPLLVVQEAGTAVTVSATVTDNVQISDVSLHYRTAGETVFKIGSMVRQGVSDSYSGSIPESSVILPGVEYYIRAVDSSNNTATHPAANPDTLPHSFLVQDTVPPDIIYDPEPLATVLITDEIIVTFEASDLVGIREAKVFYRRENEADFSSLVAEDSGDESFTAQIPSPSLEIRLYYYIQAEDNSGNVATRPSEDPISQPYTIFVDDPFPPLPPSRLEASSAPGGRVILTWEHSTSSDIDKYNIYMDGGSGTVDYSTIYDSVVYSSLPPDSGKWESPVLGEGIYRFVVRGVDKSGNEESNTNVKSAEADATNPAPATNLTAESLPGGRIRLEWTLSVSKDSAAYNIYWDNAQLDIDYSNSLARVKDPGISWTSEKLRDGVVYRFVVRCQDDAGNEEGNSNFVSARADATPPDRVTGLTSPSHNVSVWSSQPSVTVRWTPAADDGTGLAGYSIVWDASQRTVPDEVVDIGNEVTLTATLSGSQYFHIRAVDEAGNWSTEAAHLGPFRIDTEAPQAPTNLEASPQAEGKIRLSWTASASSDVVRYNIYWDDGAGRGIDYSEPIATATGSDWTSAALEDDTTYQFGVRAEDRAGNEESNTRIASGVADGEPPAITHKPIDGMLEQEIMSVEIEATVTDSSGLDSVALFYRKRGVAGYEEAEMRGGANNRYQEDIPESEFSSSGVDYYISARDNAGNVSKSDVMTIRVGTSLDIPIDASEGNEIVMGNGMTITFPAGAVSGDGDLTITVPNIVPEAQEGLGKHILTRQLEMDDELSKSIRFTLPYSRQMVSGEDESKLAVYRWNGTAWDFLTRADADENQADVTTIRLGIFSIIGDYDPPTISDLQPSGYAEQDVRITSRLQDTGSGIDPKNIQMQMNGQNIDVPGTALKDDELILILPQPLGAGNYSTQLTVMDNVGNQTVATASFRVVGELMLEDVYCYPNPFRPSGGVNFSYTLTESADDVAIRIFSMDGKLARMIEGTTSVGVNTVTWDCRDELGDLVLSSVYICHIEAEGSNDTVNETIKIAGWE